MKPILMLLIAVTFLNTSARSNATEKPTLERGWIGGDFQTVQRGVVPRGERGAVYVKQVYPNTPAAQAGLQAGDRFVTISGSNVTDLRALRRLVDSTSPGRRIMITVLRDGQSLELPITVGRESYQQWHSFSMGLHASTQFDLWPNPDFSLLPITQYKRPQSRVELRSAELALTRPSPKAGTDGEPGVRSEEGWDAWLLLFGFNAHKRILKQEVVSSATAMR